MKTDLTPDLQKTCQAFLAISYEELEPEQLNSFLETVVYGKRVEVMPRAFVTGAPDDLYSQDVLAVCDPSDSYSGLALSDYAGSETLAFDVLFEVSEPFGITLERGVSAFSKHLLVTLGSGPHGNFGEIPLQEEEHPRSFWIALAAARIALWRLGFKGSQ